MRLVRNPANRRLIEIVGESRFIASTDLYRIDGRSRQVLSGVVRDLRHSEHLPIVSSAQRLPPTFYPKKTYIYGSGKRGHIVHWMYTAHLRALFIASAREMGAVLTWRQSRKHNARIPDAVIEMNDRLYKLEVDNSTEGMRIDRLAGKIDEDTLVVAFHSETRFQNLSRLGGLATWHGYFHDLEEQGFNILTERCWWNGDGWLALL